MAIAECVIEVSGLCKSYRAGGVPVPVLSQIELTVEQSECLFLAGPSGSGKTTLLSILGCVLSADSGSVKILGEEVTRFSPTDQSRFRREHIGFVFQRFHLFGALTAQENVAIPLTLLKWHRKDAMAKSLELLELVGLVDKASRRVTQLSMGQRQRIALVRALAGDPELVLADEPTASLDAEAGLNAMEVLKNLCRELGKTVIVVTHDSRIFPMADRILHLTNGMLLGEQGPARGKRTETTMSGVRTLRNAP